MALKKGEEESSAPPPLSELLLYAAICMVGLPVEVKVKDESLYSGIFHTACFEKDRGIVLKKARKIHEGKCRSNLALGDCVDTLVVHSSHLVQIAVKEHLIPAEGIVGTVGNSTKLMSQIESRIYRRNLESGGEDTKCGDILDLREVIWHGPEGEKVNDTIGEVLEVQRLTPSCESCSMTRKDANPTGAGSISTADIQLVSPESKGPSSANLALPDAKTSADAACTILNSDIKATSCSSISALPDLSITEKNAGSVIARSSKLNPRAKIFTPTMTSLRPLPSVMHPILIPTQTPNNLPTMPIGGAQLGTEVNYICNHFSVPSKLVPQNNPTTAQIGSTHSFMGYACARQLPNEINGQYHHYQAGRVFPNAHCQMGMAGQLRQPAYGHPVSQGAIQQAHVLPQGQPHALLNHVNAPKFQDVAGYGTGLPATSFITSGGYQTSLTFPSMQPVTLPGGDNSYFFH